MTLEDWKDLAISKLEQAMNSLEAQSCGFNEHELTQLEEENLSDFIDEGIRYIEHAREYIWCSDWDEDKEGEDDEEI